ncbi:MAG: 16S rRNA (adenine(1518)-N(6)/adenine(1519)-N(6))-dimethyltransferase, partial [Acidobacteria bacterium]
STVARLRVRESPPPGAHDPLLWRVVSAGFAQRRKTILNNLRAAPADLRARVEASGGASSVREAAGVEARRRAETLTLEEWMRIARAVGRASAGE